VRVSVAVFDPTHHSGGLSADVPRGGRSLMRGSENQMRIARNILEWAATGERDPVKLRIVAMVDLQVSAA
jgi:hypothetical protein